MNVVGALPKQELNHASITTHRSTSSTSLNFYQDLPDYELSLDDFEDFALRRLKVLRTIEHYKMMRVPSSQYGPKLDQILKQQLTSERMDQASHFILRLSYCQSEELRRWFLTHECALFQHKLQGLSDTELTLSVQKYAQVTPISKELKERYKEQLVSLLNMNAGAFARAKFYAVPFTAVLDLVKTRQCFLHKGQAYVPQEKVISILVSRFRTQLSSSLASMLSAGALQSPDDPETVRITPLLQNLHRCLVNSDSQSSSHGLDGETALNAATVSKLTPNMPLCMRQLHAGLVQDKKLKHWGRLQYGLFLKGAGLSMDDALLFFQRHFTKVTGEAFQKQYAYNIRHMYGKEGKRADYTSYSCTKIIGGNAPSTTGDHHGCPYKHYDQQNLSMLLQRLNIGTPQDRNEMVRLAKREHQFQLACLKQFEVQHPGVMQQGAVNLDNVGNHPNAFFRASVQYHEQQEEKVVISP